MSDIHQSPLDQCEWAEATTPEGKKFYYHKVLRNSLWEKPKEYLEAERKAAAIWKEHQTETGKKYYYHPITRETRWDPPEGFISVGQSSNATTMTSPNNNNNDNDNSNNNNISNSVNSTPTKSIIDNENNTSSTVAAVNNNATTNSLEGKEEAIGIFKKLLSENDISSTCTFEKALRNIANDERYQALKTMSERKQVFLDYQQERKRYEIEEKKKREKKIREDFVALLKESKEVTALMSWRRASLFFESEPRWEAVESEREREDLFRDHIASLESLEKDRLLAVKKENMNKLREKFEADQSITVSSQWRRIKDQFENDPLYQDLDKFDFLSVFENYIRDLEKKQDDQRRQQRDKLKKEARKDREQFRAFLNEKFNNGELHALTRWKEFKSKFQQQIPVFISLSNRTIGSTPLELFCDFKEDLEVKYEKDYRKLKDIVKDINFVYIPNETTLESFKQEIEKHDKSNSISSFNYLPFLEYLRYKEESKEKTAAKRKKKKIGYFKRLLCDTKSITKQSKWDEVKITLAEKKEYQDLDDDQEKEKIFTSYIEYLTQQHQDGQEEEGDEEGELPSSSLTSTHHSHHSGSGSSSGSHHHHHHQSRSSNGFAPSSSSSSSSKKRRSYDRDNRGTDSEMDSDWENTNTRKSSSSSSSSFKKEKR